MHFLQTEGVSQRFICTGKPKNSRDSLHCSDLEPHPEYLQGIAVMAILSFPVYLSIPESSGEFILFKLYLFIRVSYILEPDGGVISVSGVITAVPVL